jgi:hypothetical protein
MDLREIGWECVGLMHLAQDREHGNKNLGFIKGREYLE